MPNETNNIDPRVFVLIPAGGSGTRLGASVKKQFLEFPDGKTILQKTLSVFQSFTFIDKIVVALPQDEIDEYRPALQGDKIELVVGGASRAESVSHAFHSLKGCQSKDVVLVHDAVRPFVSQSLVLKIIGSVQEKGTALPVTPVTDTIKEVDDSGVVLKTVDREILRAAQTPQGGRYEFFQAAYGSSKTSLSEITDEAMLLESTGCPIHTVEGDRQNIKITTPFDFLIAKAILEES